MAVPPRRIPPRLPLHALLVALGAWADHPGPRAIAALRRSVEATVRANGGTSAELRLDAPPLPRLDLRVGDVGGVDAAAPGAASEIDVRAAGRLEPLGRLRVGGPEAAARLAADAIETAIASTWALAEAQATRASLEALDAATRAITAELELDRVLQLIVDRVRPLVGARYAALGIIDAQGSIERFLTAGVTSAERARIGHPPVGRGLLGLIIREGRSYRIHDIATHPARSGFPPHHPEMHSFLGVPVLVGEAPVGNLYLTEKRGGAAFSESDQRLVESFALHAGIAIENARLHARVQQLAVIEDRERIGKDLHDGIIQELYGVGLSLEDIIDLLAEDPAEAGRQVERAIDRLHHTIRDIRNFIFELRPELLGETTLVAGAAQLVDEFRHNTAIEADLQIEGLAAEPPASVVQEVLAILSEALSNVARHAQAHAVVVEIDGGLEPTPRLRLTITDDGIGLPEAGTALLGHQGLRNMRGRAERLGADLVLGPAAGRGTRVRLTLPGSLVA